MTELERRLRATVHADSTAVSDTRAPRNLKRTIARRRGLTSGTFAGAAAIVVGAIAIGGMGLAEPPQQPAPTSSPDLSIDSGPRAYATVPLPATSHVYSDLDSLGVDFCGQPAPEPTRTSGDFTATFDLPESMKLMRGYDMTPASDLRASISVTYANTDQLPAFAGGLTALLIQDGVVVAFTHESEMAVVNTFMQDQTRTYPWRWGGWANSCDMSADDPTPPAGDYDVVWVSRVHNDLTRAAQWSLHQDTYTLPAAADLEAFREGSYNCERWEMINHYQPLTCNPAALVGFEIDADAGTATIPYNTSYYLRDVDIMFASAPVPTTLVGEVPGHFFTPAGSTYEHGSGPMCGDVYANAGGNEANLLAGWPEMSTLPATGDSIAAALWIWSFGWSSADITIPVEFRIWLTRDKEFTEESAEGNSTHTTSYYGYEVVGWLDVTAATAAPVTVVAYDGPADWPLTVTAGQWCDGYEVSAADEPPVQFELTGLMDVPATATMDDGTTYENLTFMLTPGYLD